MRTVRTAIPTLLLFICLHTLGQSNAKMDFRVSMENPASHLYHVVLTYNDNSDNILNFKMCKWTPGFYELIDYQAAVQNFTASDGTGKELKWEKTYDNFWKVSAAKAKKIIITYDVKATSPFIGNVNLTEHYGFIIPGGLMLYLDHELRHPVTVSVHPYKGWNQYVATGLTAVKGMPNTFYAHDFDELYDSPLLMGEVETLPGFELKGKPVQFVGYDLGNFDRNQFIEDLKKITTSASAIIGDVPYDHYTFISVGMHKGSFAAGIEHLNSSALLINTDQVFADPQKKQRFYSFLAHEYFHLYNVKRIRPIALGPFDYSKENYTNMLWVSEGFTNYYEYLSLRRVDMASIDDILTDFQHEIKDYESKPGHLYQSVTQASHDVWKNGEPKGTAQPDSIINFYSKGCALGVLLDLKIRHETNNKKSLDDVMRALYKDYYQNKKRGWTDMEFQKECEHIAGTKLQELFDYASTTTIIDYPKYFAYAGLNIDTTSFKITPMENPNDLQSRIFKSWLRNTID